MRIACLAASLALAVCVGAQAHAASDNPAENPAPTSLKKRLDQPAKPNWDQCFNMSINRGFNHEIEEWHQSIDDCMAGKIPL